MRIEKKNNYTLVTPDEDSFMEFYTSFLEKEKKLKNNNIIIQIFDTINTLEKDLLLLLHIAKNKKMLGTSFVVIATNVNIDNFPETFNIVPTQTEAEDIIEMETIERELGF